MRNEKLIVSGRKGFCHEASSPTIGTELSISHFPFSISHFPFLISHFPFLISLLFFSPAPAQAQKKELSQARTYIKPRNKNYDKAEQLMTNLLKDSANHGDKRIYQVWFEAVKGQYDQANDRMYLKQRQDTAAFFTLTRRMFTVAETLDSIESRPDKQGRIRHEYRQKHATMLNTYRPNLFNAGTFFIRKANWKEAYNYLDAYIDCARQPLFEAYDYTATDKRMPEAAYWATYSAYKQHDTARTLQHRQLALADTAHRRFTLQFVAEAYRWKGDQPNYVATLETGFSQYPLFNYFFPRLADAYMEQKQYARALALADQALSICDSCELFLFAKSSALLRLERWEESVVYSEQLIHRNDSMAEPYFNAGTAFMKMAEQTDPAKDKKQLRTYYQKARTYMEYYRLLMPAEERKWAPVLYRIYLNLNLGKQFDEIDKILKKLDK